LGGEKLYGVPRRNIRIINGYGPTEFTVASVYHEVNPEKERDNIPIGKPAANSWAYVVDQHNALLPAKITGELCLAGPQIAHGYWRRPDLTREKFVDNPYRTCEENAKMYRTGDLACWNDDGELEYVGRIDKQVKLRGFRIELAEIEAAITGYKPGMASVAVVAKVNSAQVLCAYYTAPVPVVEKELEEYLRKQLAEYMVPAVLMQINNMPLTPNGKIDKNGLPRPDIRRQQIVRPKTDKQQALFAMVAAILGTEDFGIHTDLFTVGMTSLAAIKFMVEIYKKFNLNIKASDMMKGKTIAKLEALIQEAGVEQAKAYDHGRFYPLTENQKGIYYECEKEPQAIQYNMPFMLTFSNDTDPQQLQAAAIAAINAHSYLKTYLVIIDGSLRQCENHQAGARIGMYRVAEREFETVRKNFVKPFDLFTGPLYRISIYASAEHTYLLADFHHIIFDGASLQIFLEDMAKAYCGLPLAPEKDTAFAFALAEKEAESSNEYLRAEEFFNHRLSGCHGAQLPKTPNCKGNGVLRSVVAKVDKHGVDQFCRQYGITPNNLFLTALSYTLHRYTNEETVVITAVSNGRSKAKWSFATGMFVRTLPVVSTLKSQERVLDFVNRTQQAMFQTLENELYPFTKLAEKHKLVPEINFAYQGGVLTTCMFGKEAVRVEPLCIQKPKFPLAVAVNSLDTGYEIAVEYDDALYSNEYIETFTFAMRQCVIRMSRFSTMPVAQISLLTKEQGRLLDRFNKVEVCSAEQIMTELFAKAVARYAGETALIAADGVLTYQELNIAANRIANALLAKGVKPEDKIALLLPRDSRLICGIWGIIKAGAAYVSIDPEYPPERIEYILQDSAAGYLITTGNAGRKLHFDNVLPVEELLRQPGGGDPQVRICPENLCYIIYTSGSSGKPKGVMIEHRNLAQYVLPDADNLYISGFVSCRRILSMTTVAFDVFVEEVMVTLVNGLTLVFADEATVNNPLRLANFIIKTRIDLIAITPSRIVQYMEVREFADVLNRVRVISCGGEKFPANFYPMLRELTDAVIFNVYGPTETTIATNAKALNGKKITIGRPFPNVSLYVVDRDMNRVPVGVAGELLIGGKGVGRGYLNRPELTAEKFIVFNNHRVYRSGDFAKWTGEGEIEILERMDTQVKLRGLRIELGEIEAAINTFHGIITSVVVIKNLQGIEHLCAYFTAKTEIEIDKLKQHLKRGLTAYMVPAAYMQLEQLPTTPNGKTDMKALPEPEPLNVNEYVAPTTKLEAMLCDIFAKSLNLEKVGIQDSFFDIGGTSLLVTKVVIKAMNSGISINYGDVFKYQTPQKLAAYVENKQEDGSAMEVILNYDYTNINKVLAGNIQKPGETLTAKPIGDVLLTGATGFLGIHILHEFLKEYRGKVFCLIRSKGSICAEERLKGRLVYYFEDDYRKLFGKRIFVLEGDITNRDMLENLNLRVDTVINCAANVKHFAVGSAIENSNVGGAVNLIAYCQRSGAQLLQVSTTSVAGESSGDVLTAGTVLSETELYIGQQLENKYINSKFLAERYVLEAVCNGLHAKIMRVGNLMPRDTDGEFQINFNGNAYMARLKAYRLLGKFPLSAMDAKREFSPVDSTARAILKLAQTPSHFTVFHPCNNHIVYSGDVIYAMKDYGFAIDLVPDEEFEACLKIKMQDEKILRALSGILAYEKNTGPKRDYLEAVNQFTTNVLYRLGFKWPVTSERYIQKAVKALDGLGFFDK
jgi:amino acid adenylation domain-containing protein